MKINKAHSIEGLSNSNLKEKNKIYESLENKKMMFKKFTT
jgi:hypothetical protein